MDQFGAELLRPKGRFSEGYKIDRKCIVSNDDGPLSGIRSGNLETRTEVARSGYDEGGLKEVE